MDEKTLHDSLTNHIPELINGFSSGSAEYRKGYHKGWIRGYIEAMLTVFVAMSLFVIVASLSRP